MRDLHSFPTRRSSDLLADWKGEFDAVLLPLGNGALACGVGRYLKHVRPEIRVVAIQSAGAPAMLESWRDRKSTRLNSSHLVISYAVFCLKKKKKRYSI